MHNQIVNHKKWNSDDTPIKMNVISRRIKKTAVLRIDKFDTLIPFPFLV